MPIKNDILVKKLEKAGFSNKEALIYVSLLELGGASPSQIAEYSGLKRGIIYNILTTLSVRGLINEIEKEKKLFYQIDKPEKIFRYTQSKVRQANDIMDSAKEIIPDIEGFFSILKNRPRVTYYEGSDGLLSIYEDMVEKIEPYEMLVISQVNDFTSFLPPKFFADFIKKKTKIGITTRCLLPNIKDSKDFSNIYYKNTPEKIRPKSRYIDSDKFFLTGEIVIYGNSKTAIINLNKNQMIGVIIDDQSLHNMMRTIFELSWHSTLVK